MYGAPVVTLAMLLRLINCRFIIIIIINNKGTLPLSGCGLRLDDRAIHIAVGLRLGANIMYVSLISVLAERPLTQEDCTVCHAEGATVALRGITT